MDYSWYYNFCHTHLWMWFSPIFTVIGAIFVIKFNKQDKDGLAFLASMISILCAVLTVGFALFSFIMVSNISDHLFSLTVCNASSSQTALIGILCAAVII